MSEELNTSPITDGDDMAHQGRKVLRRTFKRGVLAGASLVLAVLALLILGALLFFRGPASDILDRRSQLKIKLIAQMIDKYYYKDVDVETMQDAIYHGLVESTGDKYSTYLNEEELKSVREHLAGSYSGIGVTLSQDKETMRMTVVKVAEGSPCEKAGVVAGDEVISADGISATSTDLSDFVTKLRGKKGTSVHMELRREDGTEYSIDVKREDIVTPSVEYRMLDNNIAYIQISEFDSKTKKAFDKAVRELKKQGMKSVIYDVRTNTGGLVDSVTAILDEILPKGVTVYMLDKNNKRKEFVSDEAHKMEMPAVVLISGKTASAAEIFAGAMRDFDAATLIGERTFGKGIVQQTVPLTDGTAVKLTMETYYTPKGESIHEKGIAPNIKLEYAYEGDTDALEYDYLADVQIKKAMEVLKKASLNEKR